MATETSPPESKRESEVNLLKDARDVILATASVTVMRLVFAANRDREAARWRHVPVQAARPARRPSVERPSVAPPA